VTTAVGMPLRGTDSISEQSARIFRIRLRSYMRAILATDTVVITFGLIAGYLAQFWGRPMVAVSPPYLLLALSLLAGWLVALRWMHAYDERVLGYGTEEYRIVVRAGFRLAGGVAIFGYLFDLGVSKRFLALVFLTTISGLLSARWAARQQLHRARAKGNGWSHRVLAVGDAAHIIELTRQLGREHYTGYRVVGACIPDSLTSPEPQHLNGVPVLGSFRAIVEAATAARADTIAVTGSAELTASRLRRLGWQLEGSGIDLVVAPALTDVAGPRIRTRPVAGLPLIHVEPPDLNGRAKLVKGFFDRLIAAAGVLAISPLLLVIMAAIRMDSKGPVFFRQRRVGQDGEEFNVFKFRTMVTEAETMLGELAKKNDTNGLMFKMRHDPRVTRVGRVLRRYSLDELPQLLNVLTGEMSLVGPRPPLPSEVAQYDGDVARRLLVKPGITGLWQVSGRSDLNWEDGIRLDLYYVENWSLTTDLVIMWKTISAVIRARGAY
jgi:exopolysaccharide biosynthesis polyprenyl glycosylphosphotransferase